MALPRSLRVDDALPARTGGWAGRAARNLGRQLASLPYFAKNLVIKGLILGKLGFLTQPLFKHDPTTWPH